MRFNRIPELDLYLRLSTDDCSPGIPRHNETMTSSTSKNKAPSVLKQSLLTSGFILLLGIWHTISGKNNPPDSDERTGLKDEGEHQDSTVNDAKETTATEQSEKSPGPGIPKWALVAYEWTLSLFLVVVPIFATLQWQARQVEDELRRNENNELVEKLEGLQNAVQLAVILYTATAFFIIIAFLAAPSLGGGKAAEEEPIVGKKRENMGFVALICLVVSTFIISFSQAVIIIIAPMVTLLATVALSIVNTWVSQKFLSIPNSYVKKELKLSLHVKFGISILGIILCGAFFGQLYFSCALS